MTGTDREMARQERPLVQLVDDRSPAVSRLGLGELESQVLRVLWAAERPLTPREVHTTLDADRPIAYTTVTTVLTRLWGKDLVTRAKAGRAFEYTATVTPEERTAARMTELLAAASDPQLALSQFVDTLSTKERAGLRGLLSKRRR